MNQIQGENQGLSVYLAARDGRLDLAAPILARHLGISVEASLARLTASPGPIACNLNPIRARELQTLLSILGLPVFLREEAETALTDLSIQLAVWADAERSAKRVATVLNMDASVSASALQRSGGLVLAGLDQGFARATAQELRKIRGVIVILSDHATARYDVYRTRPLSNSEERQLAEARSLLGALTDPVTGAVAMALDRQNRDALLVRVQGLDLVAIDQTFQRFDLVLTGYEGWTGSELADFLAARTHKPRVAVETVSSERPLVLDLGLKRSLACQFCGDYGAIGLLVHPILSSRSRNA